MTFLTTVTKRYSCETRTRLPASSYLKHNSTFTFLFIEKKKIFNIPMATQLHLIIALIPKDMPTPYIHNHLLYGPLFHTLIHILNHARQHFT